ncbi:MAG: hypothetical protein ACRCUY_12915 [Thermoguttaceae bacterium]
MQKSSKTNYSTRSTAQKYSLPCSCGKLLAIDASQAGQNVQCYCGKTQTVPSLLGIKKLELFTNDEIANSDESAHLSFERGTLRRGFFLLGWILLIPSVIFFCFVLAGRPKPKDVLYKRDMFAFGGRMLYQDSTPLPGFEQGLLMTEPNDIDYLLPMDLYRYFLHLEQGPSYSMNFQENFEALTNAYKIRVAATAGFVGLALFFIILAFFMPKQNVVVTGWSGSEWE